MCSSNLLTLVLVVQALRLKLDNRVWALTEALSQVGTFKWELSLSDLLFVAGSRCSITSKSVKGWMKVTITEVHVICYWIINNQILRSLFVIPWITSPETSELHTSLLSNWGMAGLPERKIIQVSFVSAGKNVALSVSNSSQ